MKVITSIDEWLEAERKNRLVFLKECSFKKVLTACCDQVYGAVNREALGWTPEEMQLVECKTNIGAFPRIFIPAEDIQTEDAGYIIELKSSIGGRWVVENVGRTLTGVIDSE